MDFLGKVKVVWGILTIFASDLKSETAEMSDLRPDEKWKWLKWMIWSPTKIRNGRNERFKPQRKMETGEMSDFRRFENWKGVKWTISSVFKTGRGWNGRIEGDWNLKIMLNTRGGHQSGRTVLQWGHPQDWAADCPEPEEKGRGRRRRDTGGAGNDEGIGHHILEYDHSQREIAETAPGLSPSRESLGLFCGRGWKT